MRQQQTLFATQRFFSIDIYSIISYVCKGLIFIVVCGLHNGLYLNVQQHLLLLNDVTVPDVVARQTGRLIVYACTLDRLSV